MGGSQKMANNFIDFLKHSRNYLIASVATSSLAFVAIPVYTRLLSTEDYGIVSVFMGVVSLVAPIMTLSTDRAVSRYYFDKKSKNDYVLFYLFFLILFIGFVIFKSHDDFSYYHFPYTYYLTQSKILVGVGNFNHGFRTPSSIFYLNSLFYFPIVKHYFFHIGAVMIMGFSSLILFEYIFKKLNEKSTDIIFFLSLISFIFWFNFLPEYISSSEPTL